MRDCRLSKLNFEKLLVYDGGAPVPKPWYEPPLQGAPFRLCQISHACDTADHESVSQTPLPAGPSGFIDAPILFLLEFPGGQKHNGVSMKHPRLNVEKIPPVNSYSYAPDPASPWNILDEDRYGPYFSYLMGHFGLRNVYITNAVKCGRVTADGSFQPFRGSPDRIEKPIRHNCYNEFLNVEVSLLKPVLVFAFGGNAYRCSDFLRHDHPDLLVVRLYHPNPRGYSKDQVRDINNPTVEKALKDLRERLL